MITPRIVWRFARPLPIYATLIQVAATYVLAMQCVGKARIEPVLLAMTALSFVAANVFVLGINQITDIEIDKINKSDLPLASGELSLHEGLAITIGAALLSISIGAVLSTELLVSTFIAVFIGAIYSLPPLRLKSSPLGAGISIAVARALCLNLGVFLHFNRALGGTPGLPFHVGAFIAFSFGLCIAVALVKDIPDIEGDRRNGVRTMAIAIGPVLTFKLSVGIMSLFYVLLIAAGLSHFSGLAMWLFLAAHALLFGHFLRNSKTVDLDDKHDVTRFYRLFWKLLYAECIVFPALCFLG